MPDIIITPSSGLIDFFPVSTRVGRIEGSGNTINVLNPSGYVAVSGSGMSINTSAPNALLHAYSSISGATILNLEGTNGSLFSVVDNLSGSLMSVNNNAGLPVFEVFSDDRVIGGRFGQNDWIITSGGNVGIGTGVPSSKFHVVGISTFNGDVSSTGSFIAGSGSVGNPSFEFSGDTDTGMFTPSGNVISFATSGVERLRIDNIGRVGIGTTTPTSTLQVSGLVTANSGNFTNSLTVNNNAVWHSGNFDSSNIVRTTGAQSIAGSKTFTSGIVVSTLSPINELATITINDGSFFVHGGGTFSVLSDNISILSYTNFINTYESTGSENGDQSYSIQDGSQQNKVQLLITSGNITLNENVTVSGLVTANSGIFDNISFTSPILSSGSLVSFTHPDNTGSSDYDMIISGQLHLTRDANNGIYNLATEASWNQSLSPSGTLWNNNGWSNLTNFKSRTYSALWTAVGGQLGYNLPNAELIMKHVPTNRYWKVKFTSWTQGGGGGFAYERQEIFISNDDSVNINRNTNIDGSLTATSLSINSLSASGVSCQRLSVSGADLTYGGQSPSISLKGYSWFGKADGSAGIAVSAANAGTFGSSSAFTSFGGFNENVTVYTPIHFAANNSAQLYLNTNGNVGIGTATPSTKLQVNGLVSQSPNHAVAGLSSDQTITAGSDTVIQMTDKDDPNSWWNASTYRFLPTVSGNYFVSAQVNWKADTGTGQINSQLRKNGTTFCLVQNPQVSGITLTQVLTGIVNLNGSTDYVDLTGYSSATDGSQLVTGTADRAWTKLEAYKIS